MKLSELVKIYNEMCASSTGVAHKVVDNKTEKFIGLIKEFDELAGYEALEQKNIILTELQKFDNIVAISQQHIKSKIIDQEKYWYNLSTERFKENCNEDINNVFERVINLFDNERTVVQSRIKNYTDWRFPGLVIQPSKAGFINDLVSNDPLYVIDNRNDLVKHAIEHFPDLYQSRLRKYVIKERTPDFLHNIPNNQIGLTLIYNFFHYRPIEVIEQYLKEIYLKMRPGGIVLLTINDCDIYEGVKLVEDHNSYYYTPGSKVIEIATNIGYESIYNYYFKNPFLWIELKKPGNLESIRGGQTFARLLDIPK